MRFANCILTAIITFAPIPVLAQNWINYFDYEHRFSVNLPAEPMLEDAMIVSQRGGAYPTAMRKAVPLSKSSR